MPNLKEPAMISRLTASAALFAILAAATLTFAAEVQQRHVATPQRTVTAAAPSEIIQLPRVEVIGHRSR
jgi:hypothetical protein